MISVCICPASLVYMMGLRRSDDHSQWLLYIPDEEEREWVYFLCECRNKLAHHMSPLKTPPKFDNHFARMIVRFQAQPEADGCFSARKSSELAFRCKQIELSNPLSFCQSFPCIFLQAAESGVSSKLFVDKVRFLW